MAGLQLHRPGTALGLILVVVCLAYANSFGNGWHYDDAHTITENPHIRSLADPLGFFTERTWFARDADKAMFRPLVLLSLALNYSISELDTVSYHVVNLLIHIGATMLLWVLLRQMGRGPSLALLGAMLFGLHPLCTEPVNYISSRSESLASLFVMACLVCHLREGPREFGWWRAASATCFAGAMLSKETGITALGLIVLYDLSRGPLQWRYLLPRLRPTHGLYLALALGYLLMQSGHVNEAVIDKPVRDGLTQFMTQVKALGHYARLLLVPRGLSVQHQFFEGGPWLVVGASLLMITSLIFVLRRASSDIVFGLAWCVTVLSPTLVVPLFVLVNDHRLYLPIAGLVIALTGLWMDIRPLKWPPRVVTGVSVAGLLLLLL
ncbi:MAG: hypothetical protein HOH74_31300, partial [Gemmatimonadetes bacterium]|nr:hypothetical protein [Gemmatimonadota bacterium]